MRKPIVLLAALICTMSPLRAKAVTLSFLGSALNPATALTLSAQADFSYSGGPNLTVLLSNASPLGAKAPSDVLTAIFFDWNGTGTLSPVSSSLGPGAFLRNPPAGYDLGAEWEYLAGISGPGGTHQGIGSAGLGIFGQGNFSQPGHNVQGFDYGIVHGIGADANKPTQGGTFADSAMLFTLTAPAGFQLSDIDNVRFQFGTALTEPTVTSHLLGGGPVPEPGPVMYLCAAITCGLPIFAVGRRRRRR